MLFNINKQEIIKRSLYTSAAVIIINSIVRNKKYITVDSTVIIINNKQ